MRLRILAGLTLAVAISASAGELTLAWDASPSATNWPGLTYRLYAGTHAQPALTNALVRLDAGTNLTAHLADLRPGRWWFAATALADGAESEPSNIVWADVPVPPAALRVLVVEASLCLTTNWTDAGFFRLRLTRP